MATADIDLINLLLIVETIGIIITTIVIILELYIHKSTGAILKGLSSFSKELDGHVSRQVDKINEHTDTLEEYMKDLDMHSHKMEDSLNRIIKENEKTYKKICRHDSRMKND